MTLPLRRKRPTTARGPSTPLRTAASLLGLLLAGGAAGAEDGFRPAPPAPARNAPPVPPYVPATLARPPQPEDLRSLPFEPVALQQDPFKAFGGPAATPEEVRIQLEPPGPERIFRLDTQAELFTRMRQEALDRNPNERLI